MEVFHVAVDRKTVLRFVIKSLVNYRLMRHMAFHIKIVYRCIQCSIIDDNYTVSRVSISAFAAVKHFVTATSQCIKECLKSDSIDLLVFCCHCRCQSDSR